MIRTIDLGGLNCYLLQGLGRFVLVDTGVASKRAALEAELARAGCGTGDLKLILLTHGDSDHVGNARYLRGKYGATIAMHRADREMAETGNMGVGRNDPPDYMSPFGKAMVKVFSLFKMPPLETFSPDIEIDEGFSLGEFGVEARVIHIPGHSKGSIGVLCPDGELVCGDLFYNFFGKPGLIYSIFDIEDYRASLAKLAGLGKLRLYPGHGKSFDYDELKKPLRGKYALK